MLYFTRWKAMAIVLTALVVCLFAFPNFISEKTVLRVENGRIAEEVGLDDGVTALQQLGLLKAA
jgi:hypothetical protein